MVEPLSPYFEAALDVAELVRDKQEAYGDSFGRSGKILEILYPDGVPVNKLHDALTITRIIDKIFRIANQKEAFNESPYFDICGYALLALVRDKRNEKKKA